MRVIGVQCDQIRRILKLLATILLSKVAQIFGDFFRLKSNKNIITLVGKTAVDIYAELLDKFGLLFALISGHTVQVQCHFY